MFFYFQMIKTKVKFELGIGTIFISAAIAFVTGKYSLSIDFFVGILMDDGFKHWIEVDITKFKFISGCLCCWLACVMDNCKDVVHYCPNCKAALCRRVLI